MIVPLMKAHSGQINWRVKLLSICILTTISLSAAGQPATERKWIDSEVKYTHPSGMVIAVQNSLPRGGGRYTDSTGTTYSYVIFWFRVANESTKPAELAVRFSADPYKIFPSPDSYIRVFLPPDTMTVEKIQIGDYGLTRLQAFLNEQFARPGSFHKRINPNETCMFYVPVLLYQVRGTTRAALVLNGDDLFFKISVAPEVEGALIPCGRLFFID